MPKGTIETLTNLNYGRFMLVKLISLAIYAYENKAP